MKQSLRIFCLVLALALLLLVCSSCSDKKAEAEFLDRGYLLSGSLETIPQWVLKINGTEISFAEYRHFYLNTKTDLSAGNSAVFTDNPEAEKLLKETTLQYLKECYAVLSLAAEQGISLSEDEKKDIDNQIKKAKEELGSELYYQSLSDYYLDEETYRFLLENNALYTKTYETMISNGGILHVTEDDLKEHLDQNYYCYAQIYIDFSKGEGTNVHTETDKVVASVVERLKQGEDFFAVSFDENDDPSMKDYVNGYLKEKGSVKESLADVLETLEAGEISEPILESDGYYILMRMPIGDEIIEENREYLLYGYTDINEVHYNGLYENRFSEMVGKKSDALTVEFADCYESISTETLF